MGNVEALSRPQMADLLRFFLLHMDQADRIRLMAEHPIEYARLYPEVDTEILLKKVRFRIAYDRDRLNTHSPTERTQPAPVAGETT